MLPLLGRTWYCPLGASSLFHGLLTENHGHIDAVAAAVYVGVEMVGGDKALGILAVGVLPTEFASCPLGYFHVVLTLMPPCDTFHNELHVFLSSDRKK